MMWVPVFGNDAYLQYLILRTLLLVDVGGLLA